MSADESSFNFDNVIPLASVREKDLKIEKLLSELRKLQQVRLVLEEGVKEALSLRSTLRDENDALTAEIITLQGILNEKEEIHRSLQFKCEGLEQESKKQSELKHQKEELVQQCSYQIQETKLRHRKIRMKHENQLQQLIEQHKSMYTMFTPERLSAEIQSAEYTTEQLLKAEKQKVVKVADLEEQLSNAESKNVHLSAMTQMHVYRD